MPGRLCPGGAPSNTWDWRLGCLLNQSDLALCTKAACAWNDEGGFCTATLEQWARCAVRSGCGLALCNLDFNLYICPLPFSPSSWRSVIVAPLLTFEYRLGR